MNQHPSIALAADATRDVSSPALCFIGSGRLRLWGMTPAERLAKAFANYGVSDIVCVDDLAAIDRPVILLRADAVLDAPLISVVIEHPGLLLLGDDNGRERPVAAHATPHNAVIAAQILSGERSNAASAGLNARRPADLDAAYWKALRKRETPYALVVSEADRKAVEWRMFMGTYKGATDFITKHVWPWPAFAVTRLLAPLGITPNMVTTVSAVFVVAAYFLFLSGHWYLGLAAAWLMTFLDTVDGKLARVTLSSSKWGDIFDHGIDLVHPPFWYSAWAIAIMAGDHPLETELFWPVLLAILVGYFLQRLLEGLAIRFFDIEIHIWRPIDTLFRQITARRNPNLALMTLAVFAGRPDIGLVAVAGWTVICLLLHMVQILQAAVARRNGPLQSWLTRPSQST